jgi:hypothetical protein
MAVQPTPAAFTTVGTAVVMIGSSYSYESAPITPGKIVKVTATQVTAEFITKSRTWTARFVAPRWGNTAETQMDEYGMRDSYSRRATLVLATDPSLAERRAAKAARMAEAAVTAAAAKFAAVKRPTAADVAELQAALTKYTPAT